MTASRKNAGAKPETSRIARAAASQGELAYQRLKEHLTTLTYRPGDYLNTAILVEDLQIGRTPINQALHRLATEGLVQIIPRKGVMVSPLSIDDALHLIDVRLVNERLGAQLGARRVTADQLAQMRRAAAEFDEAVTARDVARIMRCDRNFHELIADASGNPVLIETLRVLHARSQRFWAISLSAEGHLAEVSREHQTILSALACGNAEATIQAVEAHIESFRHALLRGH